MWNFTLVHRSKTHAQRTIARFGQYSNCKFDSRHTQKIHLTVVDLAISCSLTESNWITCFALIYSRYVNIAIVIIFHCVFFRLYPIQSKRNLLFVFVVKHHMPSVLVVHNFYGKLSTKFRNDRDECNTFFLLICSCFLQCDFETRWISTVRRFLTWYQILLIQYYNLNQFPIVVHTSI